MGTIITVHGTYAHLDTGSEGTDGQAAQWWQPESRFAGELGRLVESEDGPVKIAPFVWSGENSECDRRYAGKALLEELRRLEAEGEAYCLIAHSHGGSVVSAALLEAAAKREQLPGLRRWITVGTPFVELRRERLLFLRLPLILKAMYVASLMLLVMFLAATLGRFMMGDFDVTNSRQLWRFAASAGLSALPFLFFLVIALAREYHLHYFYRRGVKRRAREYFAERWLPLTHEDDEAVRGLGTLNAMHLSIFHREFAVPWLSLISVFILPVLYLLASTSPTTMVSLAEFLRTEVYELDKLGPRVDTYAQTRRAVRRMQRRLNRTRQQSQPLTRNLDRNALSQDIKQQREALKVQRDQMHAEFPDLPDLQRALRFQRRYLERKGQLCNNGRLCGDGYNWPLNARLLFHLITDEAASLFVDEEVRRGAYGRILGSVVPVILVPVVFGLTAIALVLLVQFAAHGFSRFASRWLDYMTWSEIQRSAMGNDTEDEVAIATTPYPRWAGAGRQFLPADLGAEITECSNEATFRSLGKFRNAISELALLDSSTGNQTDKVLAYLTWNELIHMAYFHVPAFAQLVAHAISRSPGFAPAPDLKNIATMPHLMAWLDALDNHGHRTARPSSPSVALKGDLNNAPNIAN